MAKNRNRNRQPEVSSNGTFAFGSEHTFMQGGSPILPGRLKVHDLTYVINVRGQFKVVGKSMRGSKLIIECERLSGALGRRVRWTSGQIPWGNGSLKATGEVYQLEAICQGSGSTGPSEYAFRHRNQLVWVPQADCHTA